MSIRIAIPEPTSFDPAYNLRSLPQYLHALHSAGATPIPIPLHESQQRVAKVLATVHGILLPGSGADIDPQKYGEERISPCGDADPARAAVDELLIQDAFNLHKPILAICYGAQSLNVWCGGNLYQDIPTQVPKSATNHTPGRTIHEAHAVEIISNTRLAGIAAVAHSDHLTAEDGLHPDLGQEAGHEVPTHVLKAGEQFVNSSHHQAIRTPGDNLLVAARSTEDGVLEAVELNSAGHFVLGIQWHPERTYDSSGFSRAIFAAFVHAAQSWTPRRVEESVLA